MFCEKEKKKVKNHLVFVLVSVIQSEAKNLKSVGWRFQILRFAQDDIIL